MLSALGLNSVIIFGGVFHSVVFSVLLLLSGKLKQPVILKEVASELICIQHVFRIKQIKIFKTRSSGKN
jgi:hypothetical protein